MLARLGRRIEPPPPLEDAERFAAHLHTESAAVFAFLWDPTVHAINRRAEHAIRAALVTVVTRKVCGGNRTRHSADTQIVATVVRTAHQRLDLTALLATPLATRYAPCVFHVRRGGDAVCFLGRLATRRHGWIRNRSKQRPSVRKAGPLGVNQRGFSSIRGLLTCPANLQARRPDASEHLADMEVVTPWISVRFKPFQRYPSGSGSAVLLRKIADLGFR